MYTQSHILSPATVYYFAYIELFSKLSVNSIMKLKLVKDNRSSSTLALTYNNNKVIIIIKYYYFNYFTIVWLELLWLKKFAI